MAVGSVSLSRAILEGISLALIGLVPRVTAPTASSGPCRWPGEGAATDIQQGRLGGEGRERRPSPPQAGCLPCCLAGLPP